MQGPDKKANIYLSAQQEQRGKQELGIHLLSERQDLARHSGV